MALLSSPFCNESTGEEAKLWDIVDDYPSEFLRNQVHGEVTVIGKDATRSANTWAKGIWGWDSNTNEQSRMSKRLHE